MDEQSFNNGVSRVKELTRPCSPFLPGNESQVLQIHLEKSILSNSTWITIQHMLHQLVNLFFRVASPLDIWKYNLTKQFDGR